MISMMTNNKSVFVDSSSWISFVVSSDSNYRKALSIFSSIDSKTKLYISTFIISETITKIRKILGQEKAFDVYQKWKEKEKKKLLHILPVDINILEDGISFMQNHPTPNTFSLTDATNIVLMKYYKIPVLFSFDHDFRKLKIPNLHLLP